MATPKPDSGPAEDPVLVRDDGPVRTITLNRPHASNAMSMALSRKLVEVLTETAEAASPEVVILTGAGRAFCAGMDLREVQSDSGALLAYVTDEDTNAFRMLAELPQVTIAAVNGAAATGGLELVLACDLVVVSTAATFMDTHARVGVLSAQGLPPLLSSVLGPQLARWMSLTGRPLDARRAYDLGLACAIVAPDRLGAEAEDLARRVLECDPEARSAINGLYRTGQRDVLGPWLETEARLFRDYLSEL